MPSGPNIFDEQLQASSPASVRPVPRISVIIPVYNARPYLDEAIESVFAQRRVDVELIIVDDAGTDGSDAIAHGWAHAYPDVVTVLAHPGRVNRGISATRNLAIQAARGELVAFLDADDVWLPGKLDAQVAVFDSHPEVGLVCGAALYWSSWEGGADTLVEAGHRLDEVVPPGQASLDVYPLGNAQAPCPSVLIARAALLRRLGGFEADFTGPLQLYEDQAFLAKAYLEMPVYFLRRCVAKYRQHVDSCMATVVADGRYHQVRSHFLRWLTRYLLRRRIVDARLWLRLLRARIPYDAPALSRWKRRFRARPAAS